MQNKDVKAFTDKYNNSPLSTNNQTNDIVIVEDGQTVQGVQVKYFKDGEKTANAFRDTRDGIHHYKDADSLIGPADQLADIKNSLRRTELKNQETRPEVSQTARDVQQKATDHLEHEGVESKPLTKENAESIAQNNDEGKKVHRKIQNEYKNASTIQQTLKAAKSAAIVTTVIAGTLNTVNYLNKVRKGEMTTEEATVEILKNTAIAVGDSVLKASAATASVSITTRIAPELFKGAMRSNLAVGAIAGTTICAIDLVECMVSVAAGKMTWSEMETRTGKNIFQTGAGIVGSSIGAAIGSVAGPLGTIVGSFAGGMITSVAMTIAIDNHIEKPFKEIMDNTRLLAQSEQVMANSVKYIAQAQIAFEDFKTGCAISEQGFNLQIEMVRKSGNAMWNKINNLK